MVTWLHTPSRMNLFGLFLLLSILVALGGMMMLPFSMWAERRRELNLPGVMAREVGEWRFNLEKWTTFSCAALLVVQVCVVKKGLTF